MSKTTIYVVDSPGPAAEGAFSLSAAVSLIARMLDVDERDLHTESDRSQGPWRVIRQSDGIRIPVGSISPLELSAGVTGPVLTIFPRGSGHVR